jgi:peptidoglycan hydrolase-like protein with peptidoglycan-binding domain
MSATYEAPRELAIADARLAVIEPQSGIMPLVSPDEARSQMRAYQELCAAVLTDDDYQEFTEKKKVNGRYESVTKRFKKKSAVKKLQTYFGISVDVIDEATHRDDLGDGHFGFRTKARATSPGGRHVEAMGGCATHEERFEMNRYDDETEVRFAQRQKKALARSYHDVLSTAETRATNRAVMNLVSPGEVTAEEIQRPPGGNGTGATRASAHPAAPSAATTEQHQELQALAKSLGQKIVPWVTANVVPGFDKRDPKTLNVAEYALVKAALESLIPAAQAEVREASSARRAEAAPVDDGSKMTPRTQGRLFALLDERLSTEKAARLIFAAEHGIEVDSFSKVTETQAKALIRHLEMLMPLKAVEDPDDLLAMAHDRGLIS